jgi:hypothetical protein
MSRMANDGLMMEKDCPFALHLEHTKHVMLHVISEDVPAAENGSRVSDRAPFGAAVTRQLVHRKERQVRKKGPGQYPS